MADPIAAPPRPGRPLVATERALYGFSRLSPLNLVVLVRLAGPGPDGAALDALLPQALAAAQARHPLLRATIAGPPARPRFEVGPPSGPAGSAAGGPGPIPLRTEAGRDARPALAVVQAELGTPFDTERGPLARVTWVPGDGTASELVLTLHHAIADGSSAASLVHELLDWCQARLAGEPAPEPEPAAADLPPPLTAVLPPAMRSAGRWRKALALAVRQGKDEITYRMGSPRQQRRVPPPGQPATEQLRLDAEGTAALVDRARRSRLTMTSLLSAALLWQASARQPRARRVALRAVVWVDLRPHLRPPVPSQVLGCYVSMLRFVIKVDRRDGLAGLAAAVQRRIELATRRGDAMPAALASAALASAAARLPVGRLGTIALSYAQASAVQHSYGPVSVREVQGFVSNIRLGAQLAASAGVSGGALWCNLLYLDSELDQGSVAAAGAGLLATLRDVAGAQAPS